jgi:hypothetical protein
MRFPWLIKIVGERVLVSRGIEIIERGVRIIDFFDRNNFEMKHLFS